MNLLLRLLRVLVRGALGPRLGLLDPSVIDLLVWPNDLDFNGHMNNGRYLTLMDLGRIDLFLRNGLGRLVVSRRWRPVVGAATIGFRRSLTPFQSYVLHTRLIGWDEKWLYFEQVFRRENQDYALATVRVLARGRNGNIPSSEVIQALEGPTESPALPESVRLWVESQRASR
jgi:acyl-CoA thioesterase FadM